MVKEAIKRSEKHVGEFLREEYELFIENGCYYIEVTEYNELTNKVSKETSSLYTKEYDKAQKLFDLLEENECCVGNVCDVIRDLMC